MSFTDATDKLTDALRLLLGTNIPAYMASEIGTDPTPVTSTYGYQIPMHMVPTLRLPALFCYRHETRRWPMTTKNIRRRTSYRIHYVLRPVAHHQTEAIVPLLSRISEAVLYAVEQDELVGDAAANPLRTAGAIWCDPDSAVTSYGFITDKGHKNVYPMCVTTLALIHDPDIPGFVDPVLTGPPVHLYGDLDVYQDEDDQDPLLDAVQFSTEAT